MTLYCGKRCSQFRQGRKKFTPKINISLEKALDFILQLTESIKVFLDQVQFTYSETCLKMNLM